MLFSGFLVGLQKINFKSKVRIKIPKEEQIKVENMHEAIISKEVFNKVQKRLVKNTHKIIKKIEENSTKNGELQEFFKAGVPTDEELNILSEKCLEIENKLMALKEALR